MQEYGRESAREEVRAGKLLRDVLLGLLPDALPARQKEPKVRTCSRRSRMSLGGDGRERERARTHSYATLSFLKTV